MSSIWEVLWSGSAPVSWSSSVTAQIEASIAVSKINREAKQATPPPVAKMLAGISF
jgi:hypothetical protein